MTDFMVGLIVLIIVGAALLYIRKEKKRGAACIGCSHSGDCQRHSHREHTCNCHTEE